MKKKKIIRLLVTVGMAVTMFAGCGKQEGSAGKTGDDGKISISMYMYDRSMFKAITPWNIIRICWHVEQRCRILSRAADFL